MKNKLSSFSLMAAIAACFLLMFTCACDKNNDNPDQGKTWNENWLIGTWEGTTPSGITPFANTKIRVVFESLNLEAHDTLPGGSRKTFAYSGTFTWDVDDTAWSMHFDHANYPQPGYNIIIWDVTNYSGVGQIMSNVSLRVGDTIQTNPWHSIDLDWGPYTDATGNPPTYLDFYGDVEIDISGNLLRADYPPEQGSMIRLTKK